MEHMNPQQLKRGKLSGVGEHLRNTYIDFLRRARPKLGNEALSEAVNRYAETEQVMRKGIAQETRKAHPDWECDRIEEVIDASVRGAMKGVMLADLSEIAERVAKVYTVNSVEFGNLRENFAADLDAVSIFIDLTSQNKRSGRHGQDDGQITF